MKTDGFTRLTQKQASSVSHPARQWIPTRMRCTHSHPIQSSPTLPSQKMPMSGGKKRAKNPLKRSQVGSVKSGTPVTKKLQHTRTHAIQRLPHNVPSSTQTGRIRTVSQSRRFSSVADAQLRYPSRLKPLIGNTAPFIGSIASSERTAAAAGTVGELRREPDGDAPILWL